MTVGDEGEDPYFTEASARLTWLLKGQAIEWCRQDSDRNLTIKFVKGPTLYFDIPTSRKKALDISVVSSHDADSSWDQRKDGNDGPPPPRHRQE